MMEGSLRAIDPLAYKVNQISDLDTELVCAFKRDKQEMDAILERSRKDSHDVFICINHGFHAFVLIIPAQGEMPNLHFKTVKEVERNPFEIPGLLLCWTYELRFEVPELRLYKIAKGFCLFKDILPRVYKSYHVGEYISVPMIALDLAALEAAPEHYGVLLADCVEFAKEYCQSLARHAGNYDDQLSEAVPRALAKATATGLRLETLSRRIWLSGLMGNTAFGGMDTSSFVGGKGLLIACVIVFVLCYPFLLKALNLL